MGALYRTQILLEREQHQALTEIAQREGRSISELVREIVRHYLAVRDQEARRRQEMRALQELTQTRRQLQEQHGMYQVDLLAEVRAEREQDVERVWSDEI